MYNVRKKEGREQEMYKEVEGKKMRAEGKNEEKRRTSNTTSQPASPPPYSASDQSRPGGWTQFTTAASVCTV
jgi:hypothetical protein